MAGGLRYENLSDMPPGMRERMVEKVLEKYSGVAEPQPAEKSCRGEECILWWECNGIAINDECPWR